MNLRALPRTFLAAPVVCLGQGLPEAGAARTEPAPPPPAAPASAQERWPLLGLDILGGGEDDQSYIHVASGLAVGTPVIESEFQTALAAIRLTDRFRAVDGRLVPGAGGVRAEIQVDPWPALERLVWQGDAKRKDVWKQIGNLRKGMRPGDLRMADWAGSLRGRLNESGYPQARVEYQRSQGDRVMTVTVDAGRPDRVDRVEVLGDPRPYRPEEIVSYTKLKPGRSMWTAATRLAALRSLRKTLLGHGRAEAQVSFAWDGQGTVQVTVVPGPKVILAQEGDALGGSGKLADLVPLSRADRYSPELLDEGDRAIVRYLRNRGYLDPQVSHRREVTRTSDLGYQEVTVTYSIRRGDRTLLGKVRFEGNQALDQATLARAAGLSSGLSLGNPAATPDLLDTLEQRIKAVYLGHGYTNVVLRRQLEQSDGSATLVFRIREGAQNLLTWVRLELPPGGFGDPWGLGSCLPLIFADQPVRVPGTAAGPGGVETWSFTSDRRELAGIQGILELGPAGPQDPVLLTFRLSRPIPVLRTDLTRVYAALRQQRLPALGVVRPTVRVDYQSGPDGGGVRIQVPAQPMEKVRRLVVVGSDKTRAQAVLRETRLQPGAPLDPDQLARAQARLGYLGAFQRVSLRSLAEPRARRPQPGGQETEEEAAPVLGAPGDPDGESAEGAPETPEEPAKVAQDVGPPAPWQEGDLRLNLTERPPWVFTNSFGYDRSQGYYFGFGLQQLNLGGMGRTLDYGIRAGDNTIQSPDLRRAFPTGPYNRSVDSYSIAYTDPWFDPDFLSSLLHDRTQYQSQAAYIEENQGLYQLHRRRVQNSLQWNVSPQVSILLGHRWERVDVAAAKGYNVDSGQLALLARYPAYALISAPFIQVARDTRDNSFDPTTGSYSAARLDFANQFFFTSPNASFVKVDLRHQWTWPVGYKARAGVLAFGVHLGAAKPTASTANDLPLSERFFAGGPFSFRGVEPDALGHQIYIPQRDQFGNVITDSNGNPLYYATPTGGQGLVLLSLEYRFPFIGQSVWGELFVDSGQVYENLSRSVAPPPATTTGGSGSTSAVNVPTDTASPYPPLRTAPGLGLIFKIGIPLKVEYAADIRRILGQPRSQADRDTQLHSLLISAGFTF